MRQPSSSRNHYQRIWRSTGFVLLLILAVVFTGTSVTREVLRRLEIRYEIGKLESDVSRLEERNASLKEIIALLNSSAQQEKQARIKLGLQAPGETVVVFPDRDASQQVTLPDSDTIRYIPIRDYESNPEKWFSFFWDKLPTAYTL